MVGAHEAIGTSTNKKEQICFIAHKIAKSGATHPCDPVPTSRVGVTGLTFSGAHEICKA